MAGGAKKLIAACNKPGVLAHEELPRPTEVELSRLVLKVLAVDSRPDQPAVCVDVDLADTEPRRRQVLLRINAFGAFLQFAAGGVDALDLVLRDGRGAMHHQGEPREPLLDLRHPIEMD